VPVNYAGDVEVGVEEDVVVRSEVFDPEVEGFFLAAFCGGSLLFCRVRCCYGCWLELDQFPLAHPLAKEVPRHKLVAAVVGRVDGIVVLKGQVGNVHVGECLVPLV
jgi:hypothetical protein